MSAPRDPRLNTLLSLLGEITNETSLAYMAEIPDPRGVQEAFRKLWRLHTERSVARLLTFTCNQEQPANRLCHTWVSPKPHPAARKLYCDHCQEELGLHIQIDTSDRFFESELEAKTQIIHIYACPTFQRWLVTSAQTSLALDPELSIQAWTIQSWRTLPDQPNTRLRVLIPDQSRCAACIDTPYLLTERQLETHEGCKAGGEATERYFKPLSEVNYGRASLFRNSEPSHLDDYKRLRCDCFDLSTVQQELLLHHTGLAPFDQFSLSELRLYRCKHCFRLNVLLYGQELDLGYSSLILEAEDVFYHILLGDDEIHGLVIVVRKDKTYLRGLCRLENFYHRPGARHNLLYTAILPPTSHQLLFLKGMYLLSEPNYGAFVRFMRNYEGDLSQEEDELSLEPVIPALSDLLGSTYYQVGAGNILERCLVQLNADEEPEIKGLLPEEIGTTLVLEPLTPLQRAYLRRVGLVHTPLSIHVREAELTTQADQLD